MALCSTVAPASGPRPSSCSRRNHLHPACPVTYSTSAWRPQSNSRRRGLHSMLARAHTALPPTPSPVKENERPGNRGGETGDIFNGHLPRRHVASPPSASNQPRSAALLPLVSCSALGHVALQLLSCPQAHALNLDTSALPLHPVVSSASTLVASLAADPTLTATSSAVSEAVLNPDFEAGLSASFLLVLFSEIGDKTFFIAALLAARRPGLEVFTGTFGALGVMTIISVGLGRIFHILDEILSLRIGDAVVPLDDVAAALMLVYFGLQTLKDASSMESGEGSAAFEEEQEAAEAVASLRPYSSKSTSAEDTSPVGTNVEAPAASGAMSMPMLASVFSLVFLAEWGDKSFFSTIALAAASSPSGVIFGSVAAHALATLIAVVGGSVISKFVSERVIAYTGAFLFLGFAGTTIFQIVDKVTLST